jgi:hypothetical protein
VSETSSKRDGDPGENARSRRQARNRHQNLGSTLEVAIFWFGTEDGDSVSPLAGPILLKHKRAEVTCKYGMGVGAHAVSWHLAVGTAHVELLGERAVEIQDIWMIPRLAPWTRLRKRTPVVGFGLAFMSADS